MRRDSGFTLIEMMIAVVIFTMVTSLIFFSFSQALNLWERADREIEKLDQLVFVNAWVKDLFHSAENSLQDVQNKKIPFFFGNRKQVVFLTLNPILNKYKIMSLVKIEFKEGRLVYSEESFLSRDRASGLTPTAAFDKDYPLLAEVEDMNLSYLVNEGGAWVWREEADSQKLLDIPKAVNMEFILKGRKIAFLSYILGNAKNREQLGRPDFL